MTEVWKFVVAVRDCFELEMPEQARVLHVERQFPGGRPDEVMMWALVDPQAALEIRTFYVRGTGHRLGDAEGAEHLGSFVLVNGTFVGHLFGVRQ